LFAQEKNQTPYLTKSLANESISNVEVKTSGGSISVAGVAASEARVEVYVNANNNNGKEISKEEIQERLENYDLNITVSNSKVSAIAKPKERNMDWKKSLSISFKVYAPKNINSDLATSGGSISLKDLSGSQSFATSGGSLHIDNLSGETDGKTSGGSIHVTNSKDDIKLATSGGSIHADNCTGNIRLATSGGSLNLSDLSGNIEANTSGGTVNGNNIKGELSTNTSGGSIRLRDMMCSLETSTSGGSINVGIKEFGKYLKINNSSGSIDLDIPGNKGVDLSLSGQRISVPTLQNFNGKVEKEEVEGKLNGGGIPVTVRAGSGRINLTMK
jgi:uncharacterized protein YggU (UPF0235/DUF167 family)